MGHVAEIWRHPIKSHGREPLSHVTLTAGQTLPWDRHWAVAHEACKFKTDDPKWVMCRNFMIGVATPALAAIWASFDEVTGQITLTHTDLSPITFAPDRPEDVARFIAWVQPLCPPDKRQPTDIVTAGTRGMTDTAYPTVSIMTRATHRAVEAQLGTPIAHHRWRGNIWLDGPEPWEEFDWTGGDIRIGDAVLSVQEPIRRCMATAANPQTGKRDVDTLAALRDGWDHQHFGVYATVKTSGTLRVGDTYEVL
ncbi:MOSC domain-containing protein [Pseudooctadecabacter sp.]|uniref:MOSC domain-containing protein n=1 Tax=Pseudooctadecabacter sp. TaxID=1966338 RepID=UPI0025ECC5C0|nr:MOSC domain-containing protein [Pseudooctadecabacter sp.]